MFKTRFVLSIFAIAITFSLISCSGIIDDLSSVQPTETFVNGDKELIDTPHSPAPTITMTDEDTDHEETPLETETVLILVSEGVDYMISIKEHNISEEFYDIQIQYPKLERMPEATTLKKINGILYDITVSKGETLVSNLIELNEALDDSEERNSIIYWLKCISTSAKKQYASFLFEGEWCNGPRHPNGIYYGATINLSTGCMVDLFDIVEKDKLYDLLKDGKFQFVNTDYLDFPNQEWFDQTFEAGKPPEYYLTGWCLKAVDSKLLAQSQ